MITFPNAKINIGLNITEKRPDGYHNLQTIFYPIKFQDALEVSRLENSDLPYKLRISGIQIEGDKDSNLVIKAYQLLKQHMEQDIYRMSTSVGPHRDDLIFYINDRELKKYGSQGQQRTAVLSLKLSELEYMKSETGEYPILLLDDVMSELDDSRRKALIDFVRQRIQTFITTTDVEMFRSMEGCSFLYLEEGRVKQYG